MSNVPGLLANMELFQDANTSVYTVPSGYVATVHIAFCNRNTDGVCMSIALVDGPASCLEDKDWLYFEAPLEYTCEHSKIVLRQGQTIVAKSDSDNVNIHVWGFLQPLNIGLPNC